MQVVVELGVDDLVHLCQHRRVLAVANCADQQVVERSIDLWFAQHVVDLIAVSSLLFLDLLEEPFEHLAFARFVCDQVPEVTDLTLPDAMDSPETLFDAIWVPGQVVVDHEVGPLQVDAFAGSVGGDQDLYSRVLTEGVLYAFAVLASYSSVDRHNRVGASK